MKSLTQPSINDEQETEKLVGFAVGRLREAKSTAAQERDENPAAAVEKEQSAVVAKARKKAKAASKSKDRYSAADVSVPLLCLTSELLNNSDEQMNDRLCSDQGGTGDKNLDGDRERPSVWSCSTKTGAACPKGGRFCASDGAVPSCTGKRLLDEDVGGARGGGSVGNVDIDEAVGVWSRWGKHFLNMNWGRLRGAALVEGENFSSRGKLLQLLFHHAAARYEHALHMQNAYAQRHDHVYSRLSIANISLLSLCKLRRAPDLGKARGG